MSAKRNHVAAKSRSHSSVICYPLYAIKSDLRLLTSDFCRLSSVVCPLSSDSWLLTPDSSMHYAVFRPLRILNKCLTISDNHQKQEPILGQ